LREAATPAGAGPSILLTGASGYVGGRLLERLESDGRVVRCLTRRPEELRARVGLATEVTRGDATDAGTLVHAMKGVEVAYFLIHSLHREDGYEADREAAGRFAEAARETGVRRIVYLGGLGHGDDLSPHLRSRQEVGAILRASGVETIELRASIVLGSGSFSFEMVRALVDRLPAMVTPRWVGTRTQPIAIEDVIEYLAAAADVPGERLREATGDGDVGGYVIEIGGPDVVSYGDVMREYAHQRGLRRVMVPVPVLTPRLSSLWLGLVTPVYATVGRELLEGLRNETTVRDDAALRAFDVRPRGLREAIERALANEDHDFARTRWSDALSSWGPGRSYGGVRFGTRLVDSRTATVVVPPREAFRPVRRIGGRTGWYYADRLWRLRGLADLALAGPGLRRGRRDPERPRLGDTLDWWRVEGYEEDRLLRLRAEMRLPGRAWLQFEVDPAPKGATIRQTALFDPAGLGGLAYWYALWPAHQLVFAGMLRKIATAAESERSPARSAPRAPSRGGIVGTSRSLLSAVWSRALGHAREARGSEPDVPARSL
jgi:uncharacterized protein YbjT (DUF2867 family)